MTATETSDKAWATDTATGSLQSRMARFCGADRRYWHLLLRGALLLVVTLGLYRFWLSTDMRRFLWSNTQLAGEPLEYTGTALELLFGFLIAIGLLIPLYVALFLAALYQGSTLGAVTGLLGFGLAAVLGPYAIYRARRYRLTRTVFRGIRFHQTGSAWRYALWALAWWSVAALTLGLAYPWTQASLERFKMRNTFYGDLPGRFEGSGLSLLVRGIPMWAIAIGPLLVGLAIAVRAVDWSALARAVEQGRDFTNDVEGTGLPAAAGLVMAAVGWAIVALGALYPSFQALTLRWWVSGVRFGTLSLKSRLGVGQVYRIYLRFLGYGLLFALVAGLGLAICFVIAGFLLGPSASSGREALATGLVVAGYIIVMLGFSTIYQVTVRLSLWRAAVDSLSVSGLAVLDRVSAAGEPSSAVGEGLADVLSVGGI